MNVCKCTLFNLFCSVLRFCFDVLSFFLLLHQQAHALVYMIAFTYIQICGGSQRFRS